MLEYGNAVILGRQEFADAIRNLPGRVVQKIMDEWTFQQAQKVSLAARRSAPRDRNRNPNKPESSRLWKSIKASKVRRLGKFRNTVSRAIAYGASTRGAVTRSRARARLAKRNRLRQRRGKTAKVMGTRAAHFHLVVRGTVQRMQKTTGRRTGAMWGRTPNPQFWTRAVRQGTANAQGEVGAQLRDAYERGIDREMKRIQRKFK